MNKFLKWCRMYSSEAVTPQEVRESIGLKEFETMFAAEEEEEWDFLWNTPDTNNVKSAYVFAEAAVSGRTDGEVEEMEAEFDRWLFELIRKEREEAWLEGWNTGNDYYGECEKGSPKDSWKYDEDQNPYRKEKP